MVERPRCPAVVVTSLALTLAGCGASDSTSLRAPPPRSAPAANPARAQAPAASAPVAPPAARIATATAAPAIAPSAAPTSSASPPPLSTALAPPPGNVDRVVAKDNRACAIFQNGSLQCWGGGLNTYGELGVGHTNEVEAPAWVKGIRDVKKLALGDSTTCAIVGSGALFCWGRNDFLSAPDAPAKLPQPTAVPGLSSALDVAVGEAHACAVDASNEVLCWGSNRAGQLGLGAEKLGAEIKDPTRVPGVRGVVGIAAGARSTLAWTSGGELFRWGNAGSRRPHPWSAPAPRKVKGLAGVKQAWIEGDHGCALLDGGQVRCFIPESLEALAAGKQFDMGPGMRAFAQALSRKKTPIPVFKMLFPDARELRGAISVLLFNHDASALTDKGEVFSWGNGERLTVGHAASPKGIWPPTRIAGLSEVTAIAGGFMHRCALLKDGSVFCFGSGSGGRLGNGLKQDSVTPVRVPGLPKVKHIAAGDHCTFALGEDHSVWAFGQSWFNACGEKTSDLDRFATPQRVPLDTRSP